MDATYRLDIRYIPESGVNALRRAERLVETLSTDGFSVSDMSAYDDGMRVSVLIESEGTGRVELKLLTLVSGTGSIGRFSCREVNETSAAESGSEVAEAALV